ncbi:MULTISPECIES: Fic family protein [unclassified Pseudoalteromonas]|uniref:Fic/DOC family protein n=1 Tax=unclassified Pseudoalteromonas TaxID=194690 RepID=UPI0015CB62A6|nr:MULTISPECIES: Fic family protein [unclassified Pseudoalteromonas]MBB1371439.1 Fic family protein [Pseudoalteromonas sp. SR45-4]NYR14139.1 Fic family protein [Pseudoalteromonas sp. MIP2626]
MTKYETDSIEAQYQLGSEKLVLANKLAIVDVAEMDDVEAILLVKLYEKTFTMAAPEDDVFSFQNVANWHRQWLGNVYEWAGKIRSIDMGKGGFQFMSPLQIEKNIRLFEDEYLSRFNNLPEMTDEEFVSFIAQSHVEFILIHPFREGNGRISRLLMDFLCSKAGKGTLDYSLWDEHKDFYFKSIQAGVNRDYQHIERLVRDIIK